MVRCCHDTDGRTTQIILRTIHILDTRSRTNSST